jgi:hypothetical protein
MTMSSPTIQRTMTFDSPSVRYLCPWLSVLIDNKARPVSMSIVVDANKRFFFCSCTFWRSLVQPF